MGEVLNNGAPRKGGSMVEERMKSEGYHGAIKMKRGIQWTRSQIMVWVGSV
jgi:hypothetical protein